MKTHQVAQQDIPVRPAELFFGILMLVIILLTSGHSVSAKSRVNTEGAQIEHSSTELDRNLEWQVIKYAENNVELVQGNFEVPLLIMILLTFSYGALSGGVYLVQELKK